MAIPSLPLHVDHGGIRLAGELWMPAGPAAGSARGEPPRAAVLMVPGSGPSDRHNDVLFPPIREHLVANGIAVASFDKRGVGESTGDWLTAGIVEQADDALAALDVLRSVAALQGVPIGLFGHSQGGWVVLDAAARDERVAFVITNSGPGVTPAEQERHAARDGMMRRGLAADEVTAAMSDFDAMLESMRSGVTFQTFHQGLEADAPRRERLRLLGELAFVPDDKAVWNLGRRILDHDPRPALERIRCPILALFGAEDRLLPVERSAAVYRDAGRDVTVHIFPDADHRCQIGDPPAMAPGYLEALTKWIRRGWRARASGHDSATRLAISAARST